MKWTMILLVANLYGPGGSSSVPDMTPRACSEAATAILEETRGKIFCVQNGTGRTVLFKRDPGGKVVSETLTAGYR